MLETGLIGGRNSYVERRRLSWLGVSSRSIEVVGDHFRRETLRDVKTPHTIASINNEIPRYPPVLDRNFYPCTLYSYHMPRGCI